MTGEEKILLANLTEKALKCDEFNMITFSPFLDMHEKSLAVSLKIPKDVTMLFYGGFEEAERNMALFLPQYTLVKTSEDLTKYFAEYPEDCPLRILKITKDKFSKPLSHRDYLGAAMGLGINRNVTGDITVTDTGCFMAVTENMASYIGENLCKAGRGTLKAEILYPHEAENPKKSKGEPISFTVSSPRLDNIVKNSFGISRENAVSAIEQGLVFVNDTECIKPDRKINPGDKVVMRHKGRVILGDCSGVSKKGRIIINALKF